MSFADLGDDRGSLIIHDNLTLPFEIKRIFYTYGASANKVRGGHANKNTKFILVALTGRCIVTVKVGDRAEDIELSSPSEGLFLDRMVWKEIHSFSTDSTLLAICSEPYDPDEYIYDFNIYLTEVNNA
ncbi:FdtA/QdtA family cupin domain-containing protein [Alphaproteobacteria bacterium]|nr:FdtA/QdtA family cupin domain-containing protein [Alphaproteobacteria bacterium]